MGYDHFTAWFYPLLRVRAQWGANWVFRRKRISGYGRNMFKNSAEIFAFIKKEDVKLVDVRFIDLPGIQHHFNVPVESFGEEVFTEGLMFDGSSIRGFQAIHESDMKLLPVPESAFIDPFRKRKL